MSPTIPAHENSRCPMVPVSVRISGEEVDGSDYGEVTGMLKWEYLQRIGRREIYLLLALLAVVSVVWGFIELADEVLEGDTQAFDVWVMQSLRKPGQPEAPIGPAWGFEVARDITGLGGIAVLTLVSVGVAGFLALARKWAAMAFILGATLTGLILSNGLKYAFARPRPEVVPNLVEVHTTSFPSGHSLMSAVVYLTLAALLMRLAHSFPLKLYLLGVAITLTVLVGASRVYLGAHYPTDVLGGWAVGFAWAALCWLLADFLRRRGAVRQEM